MPDILDIKAKAPFPASALSNLAPHAFVLDGIGCGSMEGFLQGLKIEDRAEQSACTRSARTTRATREEFSGRLERLRARLAKA